MPDKILKNYRPKSRNGFRILDGGGLSLDRPLPYQLKVDYNGYRICGATLISSKHAISAAHCFWEANNRKKHIKRLLVRSGALYTNGIGYETRKVRQIIKPFEGYYEYNNGHGNDKQLDFVILELKRPFTLIEGFVQPACLPSKQLKQGDICFASGWGITSMDHPDPPRTVLRAAKMKIKTPLQHCSKGIFLLNGLIFYCLL